MEQLASDFGEELAARRCLLVLDDVWPFRTGKDDVVGLLLSRIDSVPRLITTRSAALLDAEPSARRVDVEEMEPGEATALLATALTRQATQNDTAQLDEFARRLGRWPLLLGLAAAHLRRRVLGGMPLDDAVRALAYRYATRGVTAFDARHADLLDASDPAQRHQAVAATVEASLGLFTHDDQARYRELAVFPSGQPIPVDVIAGLWAPALDRDSTDDLLGVLADLSLLSFDWSTQHVRVHDLLRDYLIPADPQKRMVLHRRLVQSWGPPQLLQDSYRIRWYAYHLDTAGDSERLYALIIPAWREQVLAVTGVLSDVAADALCAAEHAARHHQLHEELRCRLIATTLAARAQALPRRLLVALAQLGQHDRVLGYVDLLSWSERDKALSAIATALASTDPVEAEVAADRIDDPEHKKAALAAIAAVRASTDPGRALGSDRIGAPERETRASADTLAAVTDAGPDRVSAAADRIDDAFVEAEALADFAATLTDAAPSRVRLLTDRALAAADRIDAPGHKARALAAIAAALASVDPARALAAADRIDDIGAKAEVLAGIAATLADTDPDRASRADPNGPWPARTA